MSYCIERLISEAVVLALVGKFAFYLFAYVWAIMPVIEALHQVFLRSFCSLGDRRADKQFFIIPTSLFMLAPGSLETFYDYCHSSVSRSLQV